MADPEQGQSSSAELAPLTTTTQPTKASSSGIAPKKTKTKKKTKVKKEYKLTKQDKKSWNKSILPNRGYPCCLAYCTIMAIGATTSTIGMMTDSFIPGLLESANIVETQCTVVNTFIYRVEKCSYNCDSEERGGYLNSAYDQCSERGAACAVVNVSFPYEIDHTRAPRGVSTGNAWFISDQTKLDPYLPPGETAPKPIVGLSQQRCGPPSGEDMPGHGEEPRFIEKNESGGADFLKQSFIDAMNQECTNVTQLEEFKNIFAGKMTTGLSQSFEQVYKHRPDQLSTDTDAKWPTWPLTFRADLNMTGLDWTHTAQGQGPETVNTVFKEGKKTDCEGFKWWFCRASDFISTYDQSETSTVMVDAAFEPGSEKWNELAIQVVAGEAPVQVPAACSFMVCEGSGNKTWYAEKSMDHAQNYLAHFPKGLKFDCLYDRRATGGTLDWQAFPNLIPLALAAQYEESQVVINFLIPLIGTMLFCLIYLFLACRDWWCFCKNRACKKLQYF